LLEELLGLARHGVRLVRCCGEDCALEIPLGYESDFEDLWIPFTRLARFGAGRGQARQAATSRAMRASESRRCAFFRSTTLVLPRRIRAGAAARGPPGPERDRPTPFGPR